MVKQLLIVTTRNRLSGEKAALKPGVVTKGSTTNPTPSFTGASPVAPTVNIETVPASTSVVATNLPSGLNWTLVGVVPVGSGEPSGVTLPSSRDTEQRVTVLDPASADARTLPVGLNA